MLKILENHGIIIWDILILIIVMVGFICFMMICKHSMIKLPNEAIAQKRTAPKRYYEKRNVWLKSSLGLSITKNTALVISTYLTIVSICLGVLVKDSTIVVDRIIIYSILSLLISYFTTVQNTMGKSNAYRRAYMKMERALHEYEEKIDIEVDLVKVDAECEEIIFEAQI